MSQQLAARIEARRLIEVARDFPLARRTNLRALHRGAIPAPALDRVEVARRPGDHRDAPMPLGQEMPHHFVGTLPVRHDDRF